MITVTVRVIDDLKSKKIGDKIFRGRLEIIDKTEDLIVCSDLSYHNEPICYDFKGNCLSDFEDNIGNYSNRYVMSESYIEKILIKDLNDFCLGKLRKLRIIQNGIVVNVCIISDDFRFSISKNYIAPDLIIETNGDLHRCSLIDGMTLDIEISDLTKVEKLQYKREQYVNNR